MWKKSGSIIDVFVAGEPTAATSIPRIDENNNFETVLRFDIPIVTRKNQVVDLEAVTAIEVFINSRSSWGINLLMSFSRDNEELLFTNNATLTNIESDGFQRIPLTITWADFPPSGCHTYTLQIIANAGGALVESASLMPIGFVVTHIQLP